MSNDIKCVCYVHVMYVAQVLAAAALRIFKVINRQFSVITCCELGMWWVDRNGNGTKVSESSLFHQGHSKSNSKGFPIDNPLHSIPKTIGKSKLESPKIRICWMVCDGTRCLLSMIWNLKHVARPSCDPATEKDTYQRKESCSRNIICMYIRLKIEIRVYWWTWFIYTYIYIYIWWWLSVIHQTQKENSSSFNVYGRLISQCRFTYATRRPGARCFWVEGWRPASCGLAFPPKVIESALLATVSIPRLSWRSGFLLGKHGILRCCIFFWGGSHLSFFRFNLA